MDYYGQSMHDRHYGEEYRGYTEDDVDAFIFNDPPAKASPLSSTVTQCQNCGGHNNWGETLCQPCQLEKSYRQILIIDGNVPPEKARDRASDLVNRTPKKKEAA